MNISTGGFNLIASFFPFIFIAIVVIIGIQAVRGIAQWSSNNKQPVLTVQTSIVSKRTEVRQHSHNNNGQMQSHNTTTYYVTFQVESGDRMEFAVRGSEYGQIAEDDFGKLTFQGTRYLGFEREMEIGSVSL
jgi:hypothetical protein